MSWCSFPVRAAGSRILASTFLILAFSSLALGPQETETPLRETLINLERQSWEAWKNRDGKFFERFLSDDHVEVGFTGVANKATVVAGVASPACVVKSYQIDNFKLTRFDENTALLTYHAEQDTACNRIAVPSPVWASSLYVKRDGRWRNALYQQTRANEK